MTHTEVSIHGTIAGRIWMPNVTCGKTFKVSDHDFNYSENSRPSLRDMVLHVTNDGDFQSCAIVDATVTFKRVNKTTTGTVVKTRHRDIRQFPSVTDCVLVAESDEYWAGVDAFGNDDE